MKKILVFSSLFIALLITACSNNHDTIKIGAILPLTGESAYWGDNIRNGINLAVNEINNSGGILNRKISIIYEDTKGNPTQATSAVNKLINIDKVNFIIGDVISTNILAVAPILEKNKVLLIGFGESAEITNAGDYIFRNWNSAASDAEITGKFAANNSDSFVLLGRNDAFGQSAKVLFKEQLTLNKKDIVSEYNFDTNNDDFRSIITSFRNQNYGGIYFAGFHDEAKNFLRQYIELNGKPVNIYGVSSWEEQSLIDFITKNYPGNVYYGYPQPPDTTLESVEHFLNSYRTEYNKDPEILADNGYDAVMMYKTSIEAKKSFDVDSVKIGLYDLKEFNGATGIFSIDQNGDVNKPFGLKVVNSKGIDWVKTN